MAVNLKKCFVFVSLSLLLAGCNFQITIHDAPVSVSSDEAIEREHEQITKDFINMLEEDPELKALMEKSIRQAAVTNRDRKTNPVRSLGGETEDGSQRDRGRFSVSLYCLIAFSMIFLEIPVRRLG